MQRVALLLVTLASAGLAALTFPPASAAALAWIAYAPFLVSLQRSAHTRGAILLAWLWLLVFAWGIGSWLPQAVSGYFGQPRLVGAAFFLGVSTSMAAIEMMVFAACQRRLACLPGPVAPFAIAAAWTAAEAARATLATGNPWALAGYSQAGIAAVVQIADVTGVHGVSFVLLAVNAALAQAWIAWRDHRPVAPALTGLAIAGGLTAAVLGYGALRLRAPLDGREAAPVGVAIVQGNVEVGRQWSRAHYGRHLDRYLELTRGVLGEAGPRLVIWPESAMTFLVEEEPSYRWALGRVLGATGAQLIAGGPAVRRDPGEVFFNSVFLLTPDGDVVGRYDKQWLLPFAEYAPFPRLAALQQRFERVREFAPGTAVRPLVSTAGPIGILICNEAFYGAVAADRVRDGAAILVVLANDSWVGDAQFSAMALDMARLRAIEQRRWLVRASTSGPSAIVDPHGQLMATTAPATADAIVGTVRPRHDRTFYARAGDTFALGCGLATLLGLLVSRRDEKPPESGRGQSSRSTSP